MPVNDTVTLTGDTTAWHALPAHDVERRLATSVDRGLDAGEAKTRQRKYGPNRLPEGKKRRPFIRFLTQLNNILATTESPQPPLPRCSASATARRPSSAPRSRRPSCSCFRPTSLRGWWRVEFVGATLVAFTLRAFFWMKGQGASDGLARTVAVNAITIGQCFFLLNSRYLIDSSLSVKAHLENKFVALGIGTVVVLQLLFTYFGPLQMLFGNEAVPLHVWPVLLAGGLVFFLAIEIEIEKLIIRSSSGVKSFVTGIDHVIRSISRNQFSAGPSWRKHQSAPVCAKARIGRLGGGYTFCCTGPRCLTQRIRRCPLTRCL